jgi:Tfp pilus assembly protein PilW
MTLVFHPVLRTRNRHQPAMTLLELLVAISIGMLALAVLAFTSVNTMRSFAAIGNYAELDNASRNALDVLSRDIREAHALTGFTPSRITLIANDSNTLVYAHDPDTLQFTRQHGDSTTVLLEQCDYLDFSIYQRNPSNGWAWYPVRSNLISTAKLIDVSWKCSRQILGRKANTENVQTAKYVIRN